MIPVNHSKQVEDFSRDTAYLVKLKHMAWLNAMLQFTASGIFLFSFQFYFNSHFVAVCCGYLAIIISLFPVFYAIYHKNFSLIFSCISVFNLAPIWFLYLEAVLPGYDAYEFSPPLFIMQSLMWVSVFLLAINLFYVMMVPNISIYGINSLKFLGKIEFTPKFYNGLSLFAFIIPLVSFYFYYDSGEILWRALTAGRSGGGSSGGLLIQESIGNTGSLMLPLAFLWQLTPLFGIIAFVSAKKANVNSILSLICGLIVIFSFFLSGSRGAMMFAAAPFLFFFFYYNWQKGLKFWVIALTLFSILIGVMEMQERYRGNLLDVLADPEKAAKANDYTSATTFDLTESHRDNNMYLLCLVVKGFPTKYDFEGFNDFFAILVNPVPRAIWQNKPVLQGAKDISEQRSFVIDGPLYIGTTSLTYSVVGEAFKTCGLIGIIIYSFLYSLFLSFFDSLSFYAQRKKALSVGIFGLVVFLSFWGFRSFYALITFMYPLILFISIMWLSSLTKK